MMYALSMAVVITGVALTGIKAVVDMGVGGFDVRALLLVVALGLLFRQQWARLTTMLLSVLACLSIFYIGVRGTVNASQLHIQAFWFESTNASVYVLWTICAMMICYFFWSYFLLASKRSQRYFAK